MPFRKRSSNKDNQVQFESKEPAHGTYPAFRQAFKGFVNQYALVVAYLERCGIHEADAGTGAQQDLFDKYRLGQQDFS